MPDDLSPVHRTEITGPRGVKHVEFDDEPDFASLAWPTWWLGRLGEMTLPMARVALCLLAHRNSAAESGHPPGRDASLRERDSDS